MKITINRPHLPATQLHVEVVSEANQLGERPVVFILPGGPGASLGNYESYLRLKQHLDLVFHDPRGCGQSDRGELSSYNMNNYIEDVEAIRQHLGLDHIIVLGKSYGSMCALGYTLRYPQCVNKLILSAGAPSYRFLETAKKNVLRRGTPEQIQICEKLWKGDFQNSNEMLTYFQLTQPLYSVKSRIEGVPTDLAKKGKQFSYEVLNEGFKNELWHFDYENDLQKIICPTLILAGREDWITDVKFSEFMVSRIPHSQLKIFENASHALESDVTEDYFQAIAQFISA